MSSSQISVENLVAMIVREVVAELTKRGVVISAAAPSSHAVSPAHPEGALEIDMRAYRTPVLSESQLTRIDRTVSTIIIPCSTVVTPGAWGVIRARKLKIVRKTSSH
jgi:hypothetical protein